MDRQTSTLATSPSCIRWMWVSSPDPWSDCQPAKWSYYSDVENYIIEEKFMNNETQATLDDCYIDFKQNFQILRDDTTKSRPVQRVICKNDEKHLRGERFNFDPIAPPRPFGGQYGWTSPFIVETKKHLNLVERRSPSKDETIIPWIVEKAVLGIIEEGKKTGKEQEAEWIGNELMKLKDSKMEDVWKCCARLYTMDSFLYRKLNEFMRLIGDQQHENVWRSKVSTFGPFCLLLWDNPFDSKSNKKKHRLYRAANLTDDQIATYKYCLQHPNEYRSFQAFTSCSRNRIVAEFFDTNVLFIMEVVCAFTSDLQPYSMMPDEEEELVTPGVCFTVQSVEFDETNNKHLIYLQLKHRHNSEYKQSFRHLSF